MQYFTKVEILNKISKLILLYAKYGRAKKYIVKKILKDDYTHKYEVFFLEEFKMFEHSNQFKFNKKHLIDRRGNRKKEYYDALNRYIQEYHAIYYNSKFLALKLINLNEYFKPEDLEELNSMYKTLKDLKKKNAKKT